jgi:hypothetical protein
LIFLYSVTELTGLGIGGTVAPNTRINSGNGVYVHNSAYSLADLASGEDSGQLRTYHYGLTPDMLNDFLLNITLSAVTEFGWWTANDTLVTQWATISVYSFSRPLNLVVPYFLCLCLALPILSIGAFALVRNGVSAIDGGFTQLITTSTGSETLEKVAAGGCLGGNESIPGELKYLKIRFGEFVGGGEVGLVRRAGFGTEDETIPLAKGALYGT